MILSKLDPNFSPFFPRRNRVRTKIPSTVHITIGEETIECNGLVLARHSVVMREMLLKSADLYLDEFYGDVTGVEDCLDLMYGGEVEVDEGNIQVLTKFGKMFEVDVLVHACIDWITSNVKMANLIVMIQVGWLLDSSSVIECCKSVVVKALAQEKMQFTDLSQTLDTLLTGEIKNDFAVLHFFLCKELLDVPQSVLPLISGWIDRSDKSALILTCIDSFDLYDSFHYNELATSTFLEKLGDHIETLAASKILNKLHLITRKTGFTSSPGSSTDMLPDDLRQSLKADDSFIYAEKLLKWVKVNRPAKPVLDSLWSTINQESLCFEYVEAIRNAAYPNAEERPTVTQLGKYKLTHMSWDRLAVAHLLTNKGKVIIDQYCQVKGCRMGSSHLRELLLQDTLPCYDLDAGEYVSPMGFHSHPQLIKHWYITMDTNPSCDFLSLVTNSRKEVLAAVRRGYAVLHCLEIEPQ